MGGEIFRTCPDRAWVPPSLLYNGYRLFPGVKSGRSVTLTPHPLPVPWSRKGRSIPLLRLWAVRTVQCLYKCALKLLLNMVLVAAKIAVFVDGFPILAVTTHLFGEYAQRTN